MQLQGFFFPLKKGIVCGGTWVSHKSEQRYQQGHSPRLPSLLPEAGVCANESEGSPSKNISSNFHKMNSSGDAICLSIALYHVPRLDQVVQQACLKPLQLFISTRLVTALWSAPSLRFHAQRRPWSWYSAHSIYSCVASGSCVDIFYPNAVTIRRWCLKTDSLRGVERAIVAWLFALRWKMWRFLIFTLDHNVCNSHL